MEELLGADLMEHNILHKGIGVTETLETLARSAFGQMLCFCIFYSMVLQECYLRIEF